MKFNTRNSCSETNMTIQTAFITTLLMIISPACSLSLPRSVRTTLFYSNGVHPIETTASREGFWSNFFPAKRRHNTAQESVDEYLEFLDHRYHRLRIGEEEPAITAWNSLMDSNNGPNPVPQDTQQNDALCALGVTDLASQRLLQKHNISMDLLTLPSNTKTNTYSGGLFGRPKNPPSSTAPYQRIKKKMEFIAKLQKQVLVVLAKGVPSLTCFGSVFLFLFVRLVLVLGAVSQET